MSETPVELSPLLSASQAGVLSPHAARVFERLGVRRDPGRTCSEGELAGLLREHGLPVFDAVVEFERLCGGTPWGKDTFGACAALRSGKDIRTLAGLVGSDLRDHMGEVFVPVSYREHLPRGLFWMNAAGVIYLVHEADSFPAADSAACFWEREALKVPDPAALELRLRWAALPTGTDADFQRFEARAGEDEDGGDEEDGAPPPEYAEDPQAPLDERLAQLLDLPVFGPATDRWRRVWFDGVRLLYPHHPWQIADRLVRTATLDELTRVAGAALEVRPSVAVAYRGPLGEVPHPGEPVAAKLPVFDEEGGLEGDLLFVGVPGQYRVHLARHEQPWSLQQLWDEREAAWEARPRSR